MRGFFCFWSCPFVKTAGRAIRYIFYCAALHKRMPLLSLMQLYIATLHHINSQSPIVFYSYLNFYNELINTFYVQSGTTSIEINFTVN